MVKKISSRLADLEARLKEPPQPVCPECNREGYPPIVTETHHRDGGVSFDSKPPCQGCERLAASMGRITRIVVCGHDCWCGGDEAKVAAAPTAYPGSPHLGDDESAAGRYVRWLQHCQEEWRGGG